MAQQKQLQVAIGGASGETGMSIVNALLDSPDRFDVIALVRPESASKPVYQDIASRGVSIKIVDFKDIEALTGILEGVDIVISCLTVEQMAEEHALIDASHAAGVGRFVPSFFAVVCPPRGVLDLRSIKEDFLDRCKRLYLPYTAIDIGWWFQSSLPLVPSKRLDTQISLPDTILGLDGNVPTAVTDVSDIGKYVARIIADPRTLNKLVFAYGEVTTQNKVWASVEEATGETIPRSYLSKEEAEATMVELKEVVSNNHADLPSLYKLTMTAYKYTTVIRGDNTPERAAYLGYLNAKLLYPDVQCKSIKAFVSEIVEGSRSAVVYQDRPEHPITKMRGKGTKR
ncbi:hypothetical protein EX895_005447 [Sporisorium graminicola]|uniref:NmrA-like domain-containing protein n=1 Tax=Sporisorium graminicola TaxID=280036 RepID=A0A4U7KPM5_9BASI|nr:hypothetical protein EX895_005447 [Sporisorium graminicola]TKY85906.1 hypothetical protein EX895_005447 [Sporisorium graminicola]